MFVRPPWRWVKKHGIIWRLTRLPYGICEARRQWVKAIESWMLDDIGVESVFGVSQLFVRRRKDSSIQLLLAKITDDLLVAGNFDGVAWFIAQMKSRYKIRKAIIDEDILFNGGLITRSHDGDIHLSMQNYSSGLKPIMLAQERLKQQNMPANDSEISAFRSLAREVVWLGCGALPQAALVGSEMQQRVPRLKVSDILEYNNALRQLKNLSAVVTFRRPREELIDAKIVPFSDAAFNIFPQPVMGNPHFYEE